jgi:hypothetical protein
MADADMLTSSRKQLEAYATEDPTETQRQVTFEDD